MSLPRNMRSYYMIKLYVGFDIIKHINNNLLYNELHKKGCMYEWNPNDDASQIIIYHENDKALLNRVAINLDKKLKGIN